MMDAQVMLDTGLVLVQLLLVGVFSVLVAVVPFSLLRRTTNVSLKRYRRSGSARLWLAWALVAVVGIGVYHTGFGRERGLWFGLVYFGFWAAAIGHERDFLWSRHKLRLSARASRA